MGVRVSRGLFRLWVVVSLVWIVSVTFLKWPQLADIGPGEVRMHADLQSAIAICAKAKTQKECSDLLAAAGKDKFDAVLLDRGANGWSISGFDPVEYNQFKRRIAFQSGGILALAPPALIFLIGSALVWAFRGFHV
jgi:hypothetical protein